jgi:AcrR family transcriptional regulator
VSTERRRAADITAADGAKALASVLDPELAESKRERLLRAAFTVIAERGYESSSVARIARAAGMAPGLVHYYFESKDDLLVAVADWCSHLFDGALQALPDAVDGYELLESRIERVQDILAVLPGWYVVRNDLNALATRLPAMRAALARVEGEARERVTAVVREAAAREGIDGGSLDPDAMGAALLGAFDGLAQQALVDPDFDVAPAYHALAGAFVGLLRAHAPQARSGSRARSGGVR